VTRLSEIETYYDAVPRSAARAEAIGPFTLFVNAGPGWSYYARPSLAATRFTAADVQLVRTRQRSLGIPESFEWVADTSPELTPAVTAAGLSVTRFPLMLLREHQPVEPDGVQIRLATVDDDLGLFDAVAHVAFSHPGTDVGEAGLDVAHASVEPDRPALAFQRERLRTRQTITAVALDNEQPVGIGSHQPVGSVSEVVGVGVLPAFRKRGIAAALTSRLVADASQRGVRTIFLTAGDETIGYGGMWLMVDEAHVTTFAVLPTWRRRGVGARLMLEMMHLAASVNARIVTLEVRLSNREARALYAKFGFKPVGIRPRYYSDNNEDALIMTTPPIASDEMMQRVSDLEQVYADRDVEPAE